MDGRRIVFFMPLINAWSLKTHRDWYLRRSLAGHDGIGLPRWEDPLHLSLSLFFFSPEASSLAQGVAIADREQNRQIPLAPKVVSGWLMFSISGTHWLLTGFSWHVDSIENESQYKNSF